MSEDWPNGWYRDDPSQQARPSFTPHPEAKGSPYEPTQAVPRGTASSLTVDQGANLSQLVSVAFALRNPVTTMVPFGGFGNTSAGSVVEWNVPAAKVFFHDLGTDTPLPKNLITGASVAGTS